MQRSTTRQGTYYGAQVEGKINSECRGPEYSGDGHQSRRGSRSSLNSSDSARSGSGHSPNRGSPVPGFLKSRRIDSSEAMGVKEESQTQFYKVDQREFAKFRFFKGLQELSIALTMGGAVGQSVERATPGEEVPGSIPAVAARSLLAGSVSV